jgi:hypothetical protein
MTMKEVFAHISSKCRPVFAAAGTKALEYTNGNKETAIVVAPKKLRSKSVASMLRKGGSGRKGVSKRAKARGS